MVQMAWFALMRLRQELYTHLQIPVGDNVRFTTTNSAGAGPAAALGNPINGADRLFGP
jgi:hypothetical protein